MLTRRLALSLFAASGLAACEPRAGTSRTVSSRSDSGGTPMIGGPFTLVDQEGRTVTEKDLQGHWSAIYFGFTYCPDVCPTSLMTLNAALKKLGPKGEQVQTYLISVDPARDTPEQMRAYIQNPEFPKNLIGLTGTPEQVDVAAKAYRVYYKKEEGEAEDAYLVQHQSIIYLMNPKGELDRPLTHGLTPDQIAAQISDAMKRA